MDDDDSQVENRRSVDCQIHQQLECLNSTSEQINKLENELNVKRNQYRQVLSESSVALNLLARNLGDCVAHARPYYEARRIAKEAQNATQLATLKFQRAVSVHAAAREMVKVAEHGMHNNASNAVWIEMLNRANDKVNVAETEKLKCEAEHERQALEYKDVNEKVNELKKTLKGSIKKSLPYFELKRLDQDKLEKTSLSVEETASKLENLKTNYSMALNKLEEISNSIHAKRAFTIEAVCQFNEMRESPEDIATVPSATFSDTTEFTGVERDSGLSAVINDLKQVDSVENLDSGTFVSSVSNVNDNLYDDDDSSTIYSVQSQFSSSSKESNSNKRAANIIAGSSSSHPVRSVSASSNALTEYTKINDNFVVIDNDENNQRFVSKYLCNDDNNLITSNFSSKPFLPETISPISPSKNFLPNKSSFKMRADEITSILQTKGKLSKGLLTPIESLEGISYESDESKTNNYTSNLSVTTNKSVDKSSDFSSSGAEFFTAKTSISKDVFDE